MLMLLCRFKNRGYPVPASLSPSCCFGKRGRVYLSLSASGELETADVFFVVHFPHTAAMLTASAAPDNLVLGLSSEILFYMRAINPNELTTRQQIYIDSYVH